MNVWIQLCTLLCFSVAVIARSLPAAQLSHTRRSYDNFGPTPKRVFKIFRKTKTDLHFHRISNESHDPVQIATAFFRTQRPFFVQFEVSSFHTSAHNGVTHVYLQQTFNGLHVVNGVGNVNVASNGEILSYGSSFTNIFYSLANPISAENLKVTKEDALRAVVALTHISDNASAQLFADILPTLKFIQVIDGTPISLAWDIVVETRDNLYNAIVDAETNEVLQLTDWVSDATYNVFPLGVNDPLAGDRRIVQDPQSKLASPLGWHAQSDTAKFTTTIGNNVYAQENINGTFDWIDNYRPNSPDLVFDYPLDLTTVPVEYVDASITNLFYWSNMAHDLFYVYGFDEKSGNFQENNFGKGGEDKDAVYVNAQDGGGINNGNFRTPPDGQKARMRMFLFNKTDPFRDSSLDGGITLHEYMHGVSNRLTGGPKDVNCLRRGEDGGMGEGWGDIVAIITQMTQQNTRNDDFSIGVFPNGGPGIRKYPYSTNKEINPSTYALILLPEYYVDIHAMGEIWAVTLYEIYWNLVEKHGFDPDWSNNKPSDVKLEGTFKSLIDGKEYARPLRPTAGLGGNIIFLQLLIDGLKIQPCNPYFVDSRDAFIEADETNNNGQNVCEIWKGFAKRGLGINAEYPGVEDFNVPPECIS